MRETWCSPIAHVNVKQADDTQKQETVQGILGKYDQYNQLTTTLPRFLPSPLLQRLCLEHFPKTTEQS